MKTADPTREMKSKQRRPNVVFQEKNKGRNQLCSFYWGSLTRIQWKQIFFFLFWTEWLKPTEPEDSDTVGMV